jgi:hypothetical protein
MVRSSTTITARRNHTAPAGIHDGSVLSQNQLPFHDIMMSSYTLKSDQQGIDTQALICMIIAGFYALMSIKGISRNRVLRFSVSSAPRLIPRYNCASRKR